MEKVVNGLFFVPLVLLATLVSCYGNPDSNRLVSDSRDTHAREAIAEGVVGRVIDGQGLPVADAVVVPASLDQDGPPVPEMAVLSDSSGYYEWQLRPGRYAITVTAEGYQERVITVAVKAGQVTVNDLTLNRIP